MPPRRSARIAKSTDAATTGRAKSTKTASKSDNAKNKRAAARSKSTVRKKKRTGLSSAPSTKVPLGVVDPDSKVDGTIATLNEEPCDVMLVLVDPAKHMDKYFVLQLITKEDSGFCVYTRWGRTGTSGQALVQYFDEFQEAETCFCQKFHEKSGLEWEDRKDPTVGGKYRFIAQDFESKSSGYTNAKWQYWVDDGIDGKSTKWYDYTPVGSRQVEQLYAENSRNPDLTDRLVQSGEYLYHVDLVNMIQTNKSHPNHTSRRIRRYPVGEEMDDAPPRPTVNSSASPLSVPSSSCTPMSPVSSSSVTTKPTPVKSEPTPVKSEPTPVKSEPTPAPVPSSGAAKPKSFTPNTASSGNHPVDPDISLQGYDSSAYEVVQNEENVWYDAVLNQCNITDNNNKYYRIQMLKERKGGGRFYVWQKWGRVGESATSASSAMKGPFNNENTAFKEFSSKYQSKTGNKFDAGEFIPKKGKYTPIEIDNDVQVKEEFQSVPQADETIEYLPSKLDAVTKELIEVLFSKDMRDSALKDFNLDLKKLPLGVPSEQQIQHGISVLNDVESKLNGDDVDDSYDVLSSRFYTAIPHSFGRTRPPTISSREALQSRYDMCNILLDMFSTTETLRKIDAEKPKSKQVPYPGDQHYDTLNADLEIVNDKSIEYKMIQKYFDKTKSGSSARLLNVWSVNRKSESQRHKAFDGIGNRRLLWHGTNIAVVAPIITSGLRIMPHAGGRIGAGIYLAGLQQKSASYTSGYSSKFACMFLCEAALGKQHLVTTDGHHASSLKRAPPGFDSVHAVGQYTSKVWTPLKIDENEVLVPQSTAEKSKDMNSSFQHDEFLVYDEAQLRLRYVVSMKLY